MQIHLLDDALGKALVDQLAEFRMPRRVLVDHPEAKLGNPVLGQVVVEHRAALRREPRLIKGNLHDVLVAAHRPITALLGLEHLGPQGRDRPRVLPVNRLVHPEPFEVLVRDRVFEGG